MKSNILLIGLSIVMGLLNVNEVIALDDPLPNVITDQSIDLINQNILKVERSLANSVIKVNLSENIIITKENASDLKSKLVINESYIEVKKAYPHSQFKSYMSWRANPPGTIQYTISSKAVKCESTAIMKYNERYIVALGKAYADYFGQYIDVVLESGEVIPVIVGEFKADVDTDNWNSASNTNNDIIEFLVSSNKDAGQVLNHSGDYNSIFNGLVKEFRIIDKK